MAAGRKEVNGLLLGRSIVNSAGSYPTKLAFGNDFLEVPTGPSQPGYSYGGCISLADPVLSSPFFGG